MTTEAKGVITGTVQAVVASVEAAPRVGLLAALAAFLPPQALEILGLEAP